MGALSKSAQGHEYMSLWDTTTIYRFHALQAPVWEETLEPAQCSERDLGRTAVSLSHQVCAGHASPDQQSGLYRPSAHVQGPSRAEPDLQLLGIALGIPAWGSCVPDPTHCEMQTSEGCNPKLLSGCVGLLTTITMLVY